jgi:hypothetical protein
VYMYTALLYNLSSVLYLLTSTFYLSLFTFTNARDDRHTIPSSTLNYHSFLFTSLDLTLPSLTSFNLIHRRPIVLSFVSFYKFFCPCAFHRLFSNLIVHLLLLTMYFFINNLPYNLFLFREFARQWKRRNREY